MKVTGKDVAYVAELANLELTEEERTGMLRDLNSILEYIDRLNELDTSDVPPMAQVSDRYGVDESKQGSARFTYASREDIPEGLRKSLPHEEARLPGENRQTPRDFLVSRTQRDSPEMLPGRIQRASLRSQRHQGRIGGISGPCFREATGAFPFPTPRCVTAARAAGVNQPPR